MARNSEDKSKLARDRNVAAMRRLEELLRDPGPGITVRRIGTPQAGQPGDDATTPPTPTPTPSSTIPPLPTVGDDLKQLTPQPPQPPKPEVAAARAASTAKPSAAIPAPAKGRIKSGVQKTTAKPSAAVPAPAKGRINGGVQKTTVKPSAATKALAKGRIKDRVQKTAAATPGANVDRTAASREALAPAAAMAPPAPPASGIVAQPPASRAASTEQLKHLPEGVRGRLATFLEGKPTPSSPAAAVALAPAPVPVPAAAATAKVAPAGRPAPAPAPATVAAAKLAPAGRPGESELWTALTASRRPFMAAGLFSFVINVLMLAGPLFMLQVYDRVLTSGSFATLIALTILTSAMYGIIGLLELARTRIIVRMGTEIDQRVSDRIFHASLRKTLSNPSASLPALRELDNVRQFAGSQGPLTFFDAPWTPIYLGVIAMVHWALGLTAVLGAATLMFVTWASEVRSRGPLSEAGKAAAKSIELAETGQRNAESLAAMGMINAYRNRWQAANWDSLSWQMRAADRLGSMSALSKALRLFLQSLMLAIGAALAVDGQISAGAIIAGTIIFGRALAPIEQAIGHWKGFLKARESYAKLDQLLRSEPQLPPRTALPAPKGRLEVESLRVAAPETRHLILSNVNFAVEPGQMLAVIGPSGSGKSTLARTLVGLWPPTAGTIRIDGARLDQWDPEALGAHIGFLPQNVELFAGSVRDNIARFRTDATDDEVAEAARSAHAHDLIVALPKGYDTPLGAFGTYLSSGQRQRIALARALFRHPALVVLDEPNSNLDRAGDEALGSAIDGMRARGQAVVLVSHRVQAIGKADLLLYLDRGAQRAFGPRREVMQLFQAGLDARAPEAPAAGKPTVSATSGSA